MTAKETTISSEDAKGHFDEMLERVRNGETIIVEDDEESEVAVIAIEEYRRLRETGQRGDERWRAAIRRSSEAITRATGGKGIDWDTIIDEMRDDRSEQLRENMR